MYLRGIRIIGPKNQDRSKATRSTGKSQFLSHKNGEITDMSIIPELR